MFLKELHIKGYKNFGQNFPVEFSKGLNVLVGENGVGKTAIIDAIRSLLPEDDYRNPISESDFYRPFSKKPKPPADSFKIHGKFEGLSGTEKVAFLPWTDIDGNATLTLQVDNKANKKGRYKYQLWGGDSRSSMFETELFDEIDCVYLPPLRDAEAKLREGRSSRLARLLKNMNKKSLKEAKENDTLHSLEVKVQKFNDDLAKDEDETILKANDLIKDRLRKAIGNVFGQDTHIQFSETSFNRIVESLRLFFFPNIDNDPPSEAFRSLEENSLGYNNLLYIATVLAELTYAEDLGFYKILLIEEPEAHLHPQLQTRLLKHLEAIAKDKNVQVVVTTHSPVLAASASIDSLIHLSKRKDTDSQDFTYTAVPLRLCGLAESSNFVNRWFDVTKSTLLFARGVILVEGIAEAMLVPEFAKVVLANFNAELEINVKTELSGLNLEAKHFKLIRRKNFYATVEDFDSDGEAIVAVIKDKYLDLGKRFLPLSFEDGGISVINMNGIYFKHFMQLFCNVDERKGRNVPIRCAGLTDNDPPKEAMPTPSNPIQGENPALKLIDDIAESDFVRLYANQLKTFEYDLSMESGNNNIIIDVLIPLWPKKSSKSNGVKKTLAEYKAGTANIDKAGIAAYILKHIEDDNVGKGLFAQALAEKLKNNEEEIAIPKYIRDAVIWACGGDPDVG